MGYINKSGGLVDLINVDVTDKKTLASLLDARKEFRTVQVFVCHVCKTQTNLAQCKAHSIYVNCPNRNEKWHELLIKKLDLLRAPHPKSYEIELREEIEQIKVDNPPGKNIVGNCALSIQNPIGSIYYDPDRDLSNF